MIQPTVTMQQIMAGIQDCFITVFTSYPPAAIKNGTPGVAIGVMNALKQAAWIRIISPTGLAFMTAQVAMAIGWKISMVTQCHFHLMILVFYSAPPL